MPKFFTIARREYLYNLQRPAYLFSAFGTPLIIIGLWILIFAFLPSDESNVDFSRLGVVNNAGSLTLPATDTLTTSDEEDAIQYTVVLYEDESSAQAALDAFDGETLTDDAITAYFVIPADYRETGRVDVVSYDAVSPDVRAVFNEYLLSTLSAELEIVFPIDRLLSPVEDLTVLATDSGRETTRAALPVIVLIPLFFAITFWIALQTTGSFMVNGLVQEKSNRIIEIIATTASPLQIMLGKILGLGALGLTQVTVWGVVAVLALLVAPQIEFFSALAGVAIPFDVIFIGFLFFLFGYFFFASMLAAVGVLAGSEQQGNQYTVFVTLPGYFLVIFSVAQFIEDPNGTLPMVLSFLPITSPMAMIVRVGFASVPLWQIAASIGVLLFSTVVVAWAGAKIFRWGLLMYGKTFTPRDLIAVIFGNQEMGTTVSQDVKQNKEATA